MAANIIDGKKIAAAVRAEIKAEVDELREKGLVPGLAVVLVGDDPASQIYVRNKHRACGELGIYSEVHRLPGTASEEELLRLVHQLNDDANVHGILIQLPLPGQLKSKSVIETINPAKDVDGLSPANMGNLVLGEECFLPCTPHGIMVMLDRAGIDCRGKRAAVVGRSNIVGKPVALMLLRRDATVTMCHTGTRDLAGECLQADILVVAVGRPQMVTGAMVKEGAVVIDVGQNRLADGRLVGDVDFGTAAARAGWITPVPGGVGPMTITMLMRNTVEAAKRQWSRA